MKSIIILATAAIVAVAVYAAQDTTLDGVREVRDPVRLKEWLETNASDAETRIAAVEAAGVGGALASGKIIVGNSGGTGEAQTVTGDISLSNAGVAAIASGVIVNADIATNAAIVSTKLATAAQTSLGLANTAYQPNGVNLLTEGYFDVVGTTQLVFIASGVTNVIDVDITTP
jgi:hypothetical protein